jgi:hypothetical protein
MLDARSMLVRRHCIVAEEVLASGACRMDLVLVVGMGAAVTVVMVATSRAGRGMGLMGLETVIVKLTGTVPVEVMKEEAAAITVESIS